MKIICVLSERVQSMLAGFFTDFAVSDFYYENTGTTPRTWQLPTLYSRHDHSSFYTSTILISTVSRLQQAAYCGMEDLRNPIAQSFQRWKS